MDDDDTYADGTGISKDKWFELDAKYNLRLEIKQHTNAIIDNDDEDTVDVGKSGDPFDANVDDDNDDDESGRNNSNHEKQEESDDTQQYSKRTREQVINDKYILKQQMTRRDKKLTESGMKINKCNSMWKESKELH